MFRIFQAVGRVLRSVRPSQCCPQDCQDELNCQSKRGGTAASSKYYFTQEKYVHTARRCTEAAPSSLTRKSCFNQGQYLPALEGNTDITSNPNLLHTDLLTLHSSHHDQRRDICSTAHKQRPPWLWQILLDNTSKEKESNSKGREDEQEDWKRKYSYEQLLLKHSILQGLGWGSAVALTWSVYWDSKKYCPFWRRRHLEPVPHIVRILKDSPNEAQDTSSKSTNLSEKWDIKDRSEGLDELLEKYCDINTLHYQKELVDHYNFQNQYHNHHGHSHSVDDKKTLLSYLLRLSSYLLETKKNIIVGDQSNLNVAENCQRYFNNENGNSVAADTADKAVVDLSVSVREVREQNKSGLSSQEDAYVSLQEVDSQLCRGDSGCVTDCSQSLSSQESLTKQEYSKNAETTFEDIKKRVSSSDTLRVPTYLKSTPQESHICASTDGSIDATVLSQEPNNTPSSAPTVKWSREEVLVEDCPESDQEEDTTPHTRHHHSPLGGQKVEDFSDSLLEILAEGREDIRSLEAQFQGVLESDLGLSLAETNPKSAVEYFKAGALLGDPSAIFNLALCYHTGRGIAVDLHKARELYEAASLAGHSWGTYNLAVMMSRGEGGSYDSERAYTLLVRASQRGVKEAQQALDLYHQRTLSHQGDVLRTSQSEPCLATPPPDNSNSSSTSSYSTTDLTFMEDLYTEGYSCLSNEVMSSGGNKNNFFL